MCKCEILYFILEISINREKTTQFDAKNYVSLESYNLLDIATVHTKRPLLLTRFFRKRLLKHTNNQQVCFTCMGARLKPDLINGFYSNSNTAIHPLNNTFHSVMFHQMSCGAKEGVWHLGCLHCFFWNSPLFLLQSCALTYAVVFGDKHLRLHKLKISPVWARSPLPPSCCHARYNFQHSWHPQAEFCSLHKFAFASHRQVSSSTCLSYHPPLTHTRTQSPIPKKQFVKLTRTYHCNALCHRISSRGWRGEEEIRRYAFQQYQQSYLLQQYE